MTPVNKPERGLELIKRVARFRFGVFEVDPQARELRKSGLKVRIQEQPFQVLVSLLECPDTVVSREELQRRIWGDTFVDFEHSLSVAVSKLRDILGDSADKPRFIETLHGRGYRFIYPVQTIDEEREQPPPPDRLRWLAAAAVVLAIIAIAVGPVPQWLRQWLFPPAEMRVVPFTSLLGREYAPAISPDGKMVAFSWTGERESPRILPGNIYIQQVGGETAVPLTETPEDEGSPAWSPDSARIAFCRHRLGEQRFTIHVVEAVGGPAQQVGESYGRCQLAWSPDPRFLAVVDRPPGEKSRSIYLLSLQTRERRRLTTPPPGYIGDRGPAFSPDGRTLAFIRAARNAFAQDIYRLSLSVEGDPEGEPRRLTAKSKSISGLDWTPDGQSILFAAGGLINGYLYRIPVSGGKPERLNIGDDARSPSVSRQGNRLVYVKGRSNVNLLRVPGPNAAGEKAGGEKRFPERLPSSSTAWDTCPKYSPDGRWIAFTSNRGGRNRLWRCDSDGSNRVPLTSMPGGWPHWSPDRRFVAFLCAAEEDPGNLDIFVVSAEGGAARRVMSHHAEDRHASWSRDGKWIYFGSERSGDWQIWKIPQEGGTAVQVTRNGGVEGYESADGRFLYYAKAYPTLGIWRMPLEGGEETKVLEYGAEDLWQLLEDGICFAAGPPEKKTVRFFRFRTGGIETVWEFSKETVFNGFTASPDGKWVLCALVERAESDLMLVENFH